MRLLLDTHVYLWFLADDRALLRPARDRIAVADEVFVSAASIWECVIKIALRKLTVQADDLTAGIAGSGFHELPVLARHAARVAALPPHHRDPFDRLLVAQALVEPMQLLSADTALRRYGDVVVLA